MISKTVLLNNFISCEKIKRKDKGRRRKLFSLILCVFVIGFCFFYNMPDKHAEAAISSATVDNQLSENVKDQLKDLDTGLFDGFIYSLDSSARGIFGSATFKEKMEKILSGDMSLSYSGIFSAILDIVFSSAVQMLSLLASVCAIAILCNLLSAARSRNSKTGNIVHFICYLSIVLVVITVVYRLVATVTGAISSLNSFMSLVFPVLLTLMTASGGAAGSAIYQPAIALLCGSVTAIFTGIIVPLFIASLVLNVVSNLTDNIRVNKFAQFFKSCGLWIVGICFTVFTAFLSIQGISAATHDSVSIRAVKYTVSNSIPIVGGYLREGFDLILGSTVLIKNAVGVTGLILLLAFALSPFLNMLVCSLGLKLAAAVTEPVCDKKIPEFLQSTSKSISLLIAAFLSVAFMFFITLMLILMTSNSVLI